jgi:phosphohistidine phosphatase
MILYFLRHGRAEQHFDGPDAKRQLTKRGKQELEGAERLWKRLKLRPQVIITSPLVRAVQTAEIAGAALDVKDSPKTDDRLGPGASWAAMAQAMADQHHAARVMFVGHNPDFESALELLSGGAAVRLRPGGIACLEFPGVPEPGQGEIAWLLDPDLYLDGEG